MFEMRFVAVWRRTFIGCRLRVEVKIASTGEWLWAEYDNMTVES